MKIEDILSTLCTTVKLNHSNEFQSVYVLSTASEAQLASDLLVAQGLEVKVYHQDDDTSKLYVTHPTQSMVKTNESLSIAQPYAIALKKIRSSLDELQRESALGDIDFEMTFANLQPRGKQIVIQVTPAIPPEEVEDDEEIAAPVTVAAPRRRVTSKPEDDGFASGPAVGRGLIPGTPASDGKPPELTIKRKMFLSLFGNMATSGFAMLIMVVILGIIFSLFVFAKAFICPDFASMKRSKAWYCQSSNPEEDEKQKQQQERQKKIGLAPVN